MSKSAIELPLFPLSVVLFPGTVLPLHIFEPRYRQMIEHCMEEQKSFGVVQAKAGSQFMLEEPHPVGTIAEVHDFQKLDDGCYNLIAVGIRRFRILSQHREKPYLSGFVEPYDDALEPEDVLREQMQQARVLFETYLNMLLDTSEDERTAHMSFPDVPEELSYFIAYFLEIENAKKQQFLELVSTQERLKQEIDILRREVPFIRQILYKKPDDRLAKLN
ncbi:MAG TPA: LON peptidase substrate-binding domain-containing protein [Dictyobacter sp.]|jgi:Lon protease-like protein|nr:LON peptidase substrate-binding domain-containing protein [Dictyobacter sp.]